MLTQISKNIFNTIFGAIRFAMTLLKSLSSEFVPIIEGTSLEDYIKIDLSLTNPELQDISISEIDECTAYIKNVLDRNNAAVAYGGYLEKRNLYANNSKFTSADINNRNIHLGVDFWTEAGSGVLAPLNGKIHSFKNNTSYGDYGPTIILEHNSNNVLFYSLYGHLSLESISGLYIGKEYKKGDVIATLGTPDINVGYAPHLHFQLINDIQGSFGDYPGVCSEKDRESYVLNCPDPNHLLYL